MPLRIVGVQRIPLVRPIGKEIDQSAISNQMPEAEREISDSIPLVADMVERNAGKPGLRFTDRHGQIFPW